MEIIFGYKENGYAKEEGIIGSPGFWEVSLGGFVWIEGYWAR